MALNPPLLALAVGAFGIGVTEFTPMGMLPLIAAVVGRFEAGPAAIRVEA